jgi:hypothetical protein
MPPIVMVSVRVRQQRRVDAHERGHRVGGVDIDLAGRGLGADRHHDVEVVDGPGDHEIEMTLHTGVQLDVAADGKGRAAHPRAER